MGLNVLEPKVGQQNFVQISEFAQILKQRWHLDALGARTEELLRNALYVLSENGLTFLELAPLKAQLDPRSFTIATYALCGFANFSSIAIQIGGIGALAPSRKSDLARLGLKAVAVGSMANYMSACIAGILV